MLQSEYKYELSQTEHEKCRATPDTKNYPSDVAKKCVETNLPIYCGGTEPRGRATKLT